jgi:hypothetical protein
MTFKNNSAERGLQAIKSMHQHWATVFCLQGQNTDMDPHVRFLRQSKTFSTEGMASSPNGTMTSSGHLHGNKSVPTIT